MRSLFLTNGLLFLFTIAFLQPLFSQSTCASHGDHQHESHAFSNIIFVQNQKQWNSKVRYRSGLGGLDKVFLEDNTFTYLFHNATQVDELHDLMKAPESERLQHYVDAHAYQVRFLGANNLKPNGSEKLSAYHNYFLGKNPEEWSSKIPLFQKVIYDQLYEDIQLVAYSQKGLFKYDFMVAAGADVTQIQQVYEGVDGLLIKEGQLHIQTSIGIIQEFEPYAYQIINGEEKVVPCVYQLDGKVIRFQFPEGYDESSPLVIDPTVVAATLSGAVGSQNFGHTATFDNGGNIFAGGISFGVGYPASTGAFQVNYAGGGTDIAISKYNPGGSELIYATYIGGTGSDFPHSMIVDFNGQLCIYGSSSSTNYPTTSNAVQNTYGGGGADIVISKFNQEGTTLVGSTYMGGSAMDGVNESVLNANYGDAYRGEIVLDAQGNIYVASSSSSTNFPVCPNAYQSSNNSVGTIAQDAVVLKLNSDLSTLFWATYLGSEDPDVGFGLKVDDYGSVYVTGVAGATDFPMTANGVQALWPGGQENAFIVKLSPNGQQLVASTFFGSTDGDEHSFFIDIDEDNIVHIYGQTTGTIPVTPNTYFYNEGSPQFLAGISNDLSSIVYSTVIGTGPSSSVDFVPVAFMVDKCNGIYLSGYQAGSNLPTTSDAIQQTGYNLFYLAQLTPNATALNFGTYYGDAFHVDGGTSRFDKGGIVYQAVCSGAASTMNTQPNAWSPNQSVAWDIGVFKIDFEIATVTAAALAEPSTSGCAPYTVAFQYTGQDAVSYLWDFGTGVTSTEMNPSYTFTEAGIYTVMQVVNSASTCNETDTFYLQIDVLDNSTTRSDTTFCAGASDLFLDASTANASYLWQDGNTGATYQVSAVGTYWVDVSIAGCTRRDSFVVNSATSFQLDIGEDQSFCNASSYDISAASPWAVSYLWNTGSTDSVLTVNTSGEYAVSVQDSGGCEVTDNIVVTFNTAPPLNIGSDTTICDGSNLMIDATTPNATYLWQDGSTLATYEASSTGSYSVEITVDGCTNTDTLILSYGTALPLELGDYQSLCDVANFTIDATTTGAVSYSWNTGANDPVIQISNSGIYSVTITNVEGCTTEDDVSLQFSSGPVVTLGPDTTLCEGESTILSVIATGSVVVVWQDGSIGPNYLANTEGLYWVTANNNGCMGGDTLQVNYSTSPGVEFTGNELLCNGDASGSIHAIVATDGAELHYVWSNGSTTADISGLASGSYQVTITNEFDCLFETEVTITEPGPILFQTMAEDIICYGDTDGVLLIDSAIGGLSPYTYSIDGSDFTENKIYHDLEGGDYEIVVADANGCTGTKLASIYEPAEVFLDAGDDKSINLGDSVQIDGMLYPEVDQVLDWTLGENISCTDCLQPYASPEHTNDYVIITVDSITGCTLRDTMRIYVNKSRNVYIPNAFTPNGDGANDYFFPFGDSSVKKVNYFRVFDRWGELVHQATNFEISNPDYGWDGRLNGKFMNPAVYVFVAEIEFVDDVVKLFKGDVTLFR